LQRHISPLDCAKKLFKPLKDAASLGVYYEKKSGGGLFFMIDVLSRMVFGHFGPNCKREVFHKFLLKQG